MEAYGIGRHTNTLPYTSLAHAHRGINKDNRYTESHSQLNMPLISLIYAWKSRPQLIISTYMVREALINTATGLIAIWDPRSSVDNLALENVQKFAGRVITGKWKEPYSILLEELNWLPLTIRRKTKSML